MYLPPPEANGILQKMQQITSIPHKNLTFDFVPPPKRGRNNILTPRGPSFTRDPPPPPHPPYQKILQLHHQLINNDCSLKLAQSQARALSVAHTTHCRR